MYKIRLATYREILFPLKRHVMQISAEKYMHFYGNVIEIYKISKTILMHLYKQKGAYIIEF